MAEHVCPPWVGYLLASPLRKLIHNPKKILGPYIKEGMTVLEVGPAMGFFSIPAAKMAGKNGKVICVDVQKKMLEKLKKRAVKAGVEDIIETRLCKTESLGLEDLEEKIDFAMAIAVIHETPNPALFVKEVCATLKSGALLFVQEPSGHVSDELFKKTIENIKKCGLKIVSEPKSKSKKIATFQK